MNDERGREGSEGAGGFGGSARATGGHDGLDAATGRMQQAATMEEMRTQEEHLEGAFYVSFIELSN